MADICFSQWRYKYIRQFAPPSTRRNDAARIQISQKKYTSSYEYTQTARTRKIDTLEHGSTSTRVLGACHLRNNQKNHMSIVVRLPLQNMQSREMNVRTPRGINTRKYPETGAPSKFISRSIGNANGQQLLSNKSKASTRDHKPYVYSELRQFTCLRFRQ